VVHHGCFGGIVVVHGCTELRHTAALIFGLVVGTQFDAGFSTSITVRRKMRCMLMNGARSASTIGCTPVVRSDEDGKPSTRAARVVR
jgi:hypothetical protein